MTNSINELKSYTEYNVNAPTNVFTIGFQYEYNVDHVNVYVDGVEATAAGYTIQHDSHGTVTLTPAVPTGVVRLSRETDIDTSAHTFSAGAKFTAGNMDENFEQIRHSQQEVRDGFSKLSDDTYAIIDTLQDVGQAAQDAADAAEQAAITANDAAAQVNDKVSYEDLNTAIAATPHNTMVGRDAVEAHPASAISYGAINQKAYNDGLESIAEILAIQNPVNGMTIKAKSFNSDLMFKGGGKFTFVAGDLTTPNDVNIFAGNGGNWHRLNWKQPSIYDAGLTGDEVDTSLVNTKLQALVDAATANNLSVSLKGKTIKFTELDLPSNLHIYNGTLDATSSTWHLTYGRGVMMFKTTPRNNVGIDYEQQSNYAALEETKNIKFVNVKFKAIEKMGYFYKFDGLEFLNCGGEWQTRHLFKLIGGWAGTPLVNDTPSSYNLIDPINGRNKNILIKDCAWKGGYINGEYSSPFHLVACEEVDFVRGNIDAGLGYHIDIYNKNIRLHSANYRNTNSQIVTDVVSGVAEPDMLAVYVGQNSYGVEINGGNWIDFGKKGLYVEVGSKVLVDGVTAEITVPNSDTTFIDMQANYRDNTNTYWGNCADITIRNVKSKGTKYGIVTSSFNSVRSIKELNIFDADITTYANQQGLTLRGVDTYTIDNVRSNGHLFIGGNNFNGNIKGGSFYNATNYALYVSDLMSGELPKIRHTDFIVGTGAVIYNNGGATKYGKIVGGEIYADDFTGPVIANGASASELIVVDFEYKGERHIIHPHTLTVGVGAKTAFYYNDGRFKPSWSCAANVVAGDTVGDLDIRANVVNGAIHITIENKSGTAINSLPIAIVLKLGTYASRTYPN